MAAAHTKSGLPGLMLPPLLTGGSKKSQRRDINKALEYWKDYKARKESQK
jgi:hypothetical protein